MKHMTSLLKLTTFIKTLYTAEQSDPNKQTEFLNVETPMLNTNHRNLCQGYVTEHELHIALQTMENNKSPGLDGLSANFYKHFWHILGPELTHI